MSKSPISNHVEEEHEIAGEVSPAPLGELRAIVPTEQQTERKHEGLHLQLPSTDLLLGREFWALHSGEPTLQIKEATQFLQSVLTLSGDTFFQCNSNKINKITD